MSKTLLFVIIMLFTAFMGRRAATLVAKSRKEAKGKKTPYTTLAIITLVNAVLGAILIFPFSPYTYFIALIFLGFVQLINREGELRRKSWNTLAIAYSILLALSVAEHFMNALGGPQKWMWIFIIPMLFPFITGAIQSARLRKDNNDSEGGFSIQDIVVWVIIAILIIIVIAIATKITRG